MQDGAGLRSQFARFLRRARAIHAPHLGDHSTIVDQLHDLAWRQPMNQLPQRGLGFLNGDSGHLSIPLVQERPIAFLLGLYQPNPLRQEFLHHALFDLPGLGQVHSPGGRVRGRGVRAAQLAAIPAVATFHDSSARQSRPSA